MHLLIAVVNDPEKVDEILSGYLEVGITGATIISGFTIKRGGPPSGRGGAVRVGTGSPTITAIGRGASRRDPLGSRVKVPAQYTGTTGTPAAMASTNGPFLNG